MKIVLKDMKLVVKTLKIPEIRLPKHLDDQQP